MVDVTSAPVLGFLGGVLGGVLSGGLSQLMAYIRRRRRHLDELRSVLREARSLTESQLSAADAGHGEMTDEDIIRLQSRLKEVRLRASYLMSEDLREKIDDVEKQFDYISHSAGNASTTLNNSQLENRFTKNLNKLLIHYLAGSSNHY